jgi:hypothetical protein
VNSAILTVIFAIGVNKKWVLQVAFRGQYAGENHLQISPRCFMLVRSRHLVEILNPLIVEYKAGYWEECAVNLAINDDITGFTGNQFEVKLFCCSLKYP